MIKLIEKGTTLYNESKKDAIILQSFYDRLYESIFLNSKMKYLTLINQFLDKQISSEEFLDEFFKLKRQNEMFYLDLKFDIEKLTSFDITLKIKGFARIINEVESYCRILETDDNIREDFEINEQEFYLLIEKLKPRLLLILNQ